MNRTESDMRSRVQRYKGMRDRILLAAGKYKGNYAHDVLKQANFEILRSELSEMRGDALVGRLLGEALLWELFKRDMVDEKEIDERVVQLLQTLTSDLPGHVKRVMRYRKRIEAKIFGAALKNAEPKPEA